MTNYKDDIAKSACSTIYDIIDRCHEYLPTQWKTRPWTHPELNHGVDLLASEEALNCYMSAYGEMHSVKCRAAMMNFPFDKLKGSIEIVDWGCGQGIGSGTIVDILKQHQLLNWVKRITLVEPSPNAMQRAECNLMKIVQGNIEIVPINQFMPATETSDNTLNSIGYTYTNVIHIFSNILDVATIDLARVAKMVASSHGQHYIICIGPKNAAAYRIEQFCSAFGDQQYFSCIDSARFDRTKRTGHSFTCITRCFAYNGAPLDFGKMASISSSAEKVFNDYDLQLQIQNKILTPQKARVAYRLQSILAIDDILYISPVVNEAIVDFIIVRPNTGVLLVNVFEESLEECQLSADGKEILCSSQTYQSPIDLISLCQNSIKDGIEELLISTIEDKRNFSLIKKIVVFTENNKQEVCNFFHTDSGQKNYTHLYGSELINDRQTCRNLFQDIGLTHHNHYFDDCVKRKLASIISPSWHSYQEGRNGLEPKGAQRELVKSVDTQQKISGVAGAGKTYVLAQRAVNAMKRTGGDVLILTYNITLTNYLKFRLSELREDFSWNKVDIYHYHQFFRIQSSEYKLHVSFGSYDDLHHFEKVEIKKHYAAIFVDEVQDYTTEWLRIVMQNFLVPGGEFVVFGDPKQNVYHRPLDSNGDIRLGIIGGQWNRQLSNSHRFTNPRLAKLAMAFQSTYMLNIPKDDIQTEETMGNTLNFKIVSYSDIRNNFSLEKLISTITQYIRNDGKEVKNFVVLAPTIQLLRNVDKFYRQATGNKTEVTFVNSENYERLKSIHNVTDISNANWQFKRDYEALERSRKLQFTTDKRCLKLSTVQSFKGWESPAVILILEDESTIAGGTFNPATPETIYTAITRARENLYIISIGNTIYDDFFREQAI